MQPQLDEERTAPATEAPPAAGDGPAWRTRIARWLPALAVAAAVVGCLLAVDTAVSDIARYAGYIGWAVVLPGVLVYRALRRTPHSLVDDLATGSALGLVLEIAAVVVTGALGIRHLLPGWPLLVVAAFVAVPRLRRHWRTPSGYRRAPVSWAWAVAAVAVFLVGYLTMAFLRVNQPVPTTRPNLYLIDALFSVSLAGEVTHHFPPMSPSVAGEPLTYHWFVFGHMASAGTISGVELPAIVFRLAPPTIAVLAVVLLAVAGWRASGRPWVGALAAALTYAVGELVMPARDLVLPGGITVHYSWAGPSLLYGAIFTAALIGVISERLRGAADPAPSGRSGWALLACFALVAPGAKSTVVPVVLCGVGIVCLVQLLRRRLTPAPWVAGAILLAAQAAATVVLYRFQTHSLEFGPLATLDRFLAATIDRPWWKDAAVTGFVLGAYLLFMMTRLVGIPVLVRVRDSWGEVEWFLLGGLLGGAGASLLLSHVAYGEHYFLIAGWPFGAILSAAGVVALVERHRIPAPTVAVTVGGALVLAVVIAVVTSAAAGPPAQAGYRLLLPVYRVAAFVAVAAALAAAIAFVVHRRRPGRRGVVAFAALAVLLAAGTPRMGWDARVNPNMGTGYHVLVTPEQARAARWVRANSDPDDVVATNVHRMSPAPAPDWSLSFWISAFTERRVLLESWGYTVRAVDSGGVSRFWDPDLLAANDNAIYATTPDGLAWLRARGVHWIVVDRRYGHESPDLANLAALRWNGADIAVYELTS